jgi:hypothetical protein
VNGEPQTVHLRRRVLDVGAYRRSAVESDYASLITEPTVVYDVDTQAVQLVYVAVEEDTTALVAALRRLDIRRRTRTAGMASLSREFGSHPRNRLKNNFCGPASLAREDAEAHAALAHAAGMVLRAYEKYNPALAQRHERLARGVRPEWRLEGTAFTSGIVNRDSPLPYHFDTGNFKGVWSGMLGFKRDVEGGYLAVPEYDVAFEIADQSLLLFDGQGLLHGVTPFVKTRGTGYRFTVVYYSLDRMWLCLPPSEESKRRFR